MAGEDRKFEIRLGVRVSGDNEAKNRLKGVSRLIEFTRRRGEALNRLRVRPAISLRDRASSGLKVIREGLIGLTKKSWTVTIKVHDQATAKIRSILSTATNPTTVIGAGATGTLALAGPLKLAGEMENAAIAMEFFNKTAAEGQKMMEKLMLFTAQTPFEFPFIREQSVGLMGMYRGMGLNVAQMQNQTLRALTAFGDAAGFTGAGQEGMKLALLGFRQIGTIGKLNLEELKQVTENLLIPMELVRKELGLTKKEMSKIGDLSIDAARAQEAILRALEKNFGGGMKKLSKTTLGMWSTLKDSGRFALTAFGEGMMNPIKRIMIDLIGASDITSDEFKKFLDKLRDMGHKVGWTLEQSYFKVKQFFKNLNSDPEFAKLDFAGKVLFIFEKTLDRVEKWLKGPGGERLGKVFKEVAEIAIVAWLQAMGSLISSGWENLMEGNLTTGGGLMLLASALGGGFLVKKAWGGIKGGVSFGKKLWGAIRGGGNAAETAAQAAKAATTTAAASNAAKVIYGADGSVLKTVGAVNNVASGAAIATKATAETSKAASTISKASKIVGRAAIPLAVATDAAEILTSDKPIQTTVQVAAGWATGAAGAKIGAAIGTAIAPGVGTAIGAAIGGIAGYFTGRAGAKAIMNAGEKTETTTSSAVDTNGASEQFNAVLENAKINFQKSSSEIIANMGVWNQNIIRIQNVIDTLSNNIQAVGQAVTINLAQLAGIIQEAKANISSLAAQAPAISYQPVVSSNGNGGITMNVNGNSFTFQWEKDEEKLAMQVGRIFVAEMKKRMENRK